jgi:AAA15 family ATPase/GTPase
MLIQFSATNFLSFKDKVTLSLAAGKIKSKNHELDKGAIFSAINELPLLKCAVIYGANASGKSNIFEAVKFAKSFVINSSKESQADESIPVTPYRLSTESQVKASEFEIVFSTNGKVYEYSFAVDSAAVHYEKLALHKKTREITLFERDAKGIRLHKEFSEGDRLAEKTRSNALFLSVCANFDGEISTSILRWFRRIRVISGLVDNGLMSFTQKCLEKKEGGESRQISSLLKSFDLGLERVTVGKQINDGLPNDMPEEVKSIFSQLKKLGNAKVQVMKRVESFHKVFDDSGKIVGETAFDLDNDESEGSKKLVALSGPIVDTLNNSHVLLIDEFDARLHPILSKTIIKLFNSEETNANNAQLIVATHDTNLLDRDLLRRDQIWFTEKDRFGSSHLTSLVEYKVRNDASFEKDYIMGKYGAIPILGNLADIFGVHEPDSAAANEEHVV